MKKTFLSLFLLASLGVNAQGFENATSAVKNMGLGWNLGNTLDCHSGDVNNMWIEHWANTAEGYETAWGQPLTTRELIHMFKEAGFNAIRIPVTWYPHMVREWTFDTWENSIWDHDANPMEKYVDPLWMARVHEVVDYVIDEGMYCVLNVHHDTGAANTSWLVAEMDNYNKNHELYEWLWTEIANEFSSYDEHLLFEGYNEMLDKYNSWCFASMNAQGSYNADDAADAYDAVNHYAQSFVDAVRSTGGNNAERNLIVNTYGACNGDGNWSDHLVEPLRNMNLPADEADGHILFEVHSYPSISRGADDAMNTTNQCFKSIKENLESKGAPVVIGEWSTSGVDSNSDYKNNREEFLKFIEKFVASATENGFATFYWMGLSDGADRSAPQMSMPDAVESIKAGYEAGVAAGIKDVTTVGDSLQSDVYDLQGRKIAAPHKGIYIKGNKKYVVD